MLKYKNFYQSEARSKCMVVYNIINDSRILFHHLEVRLISFFLHGLWNCLTEGPPLVGGAKTAFILHFWGSLKISMLEM